eukprot:jgi/Tetstr1/463984/TSEL_008789.t1
MPPNLRRYIENGITLECPVDTIINLKTNRCIQDNAANRKRLAYPLKPCPSDTPFRNPTTNRCLTDTVANRKKLGLPLVDRTKPAVVFDDAPKATTPASKKKATETTETPKTEQKKTPKAETPKKKNDVSISEKPVPPANMFYERTRKEKTLGLPPVRMVFADVEQYKRKPITKKQAEKTSLASHLYKLVYGDASSKYELDFLDKMSLVNNDSAKWQGVEASYSKGWISHVNAVIYDLEKQELEIFEPHGANKITDFEDLMRKEMYKAIHTVFKRHLPVKKFHSPMDFCPGPQSADASMPSYVNAFMIKNKPKGYCAAWSLYYLDLRLSNPDVPRKELMTGFMMSRFWRKSLSFINAYSNFIIKMYEDLLANPDFRDPKYGQKNEDMAIAERMRQVIGAVDGNGEKIE